MVGGRNTQETKFKSLRCDCVIGLHGAWNIATIDYLQVKDTPKDNNYLSWKSIMNFYDEDYDFVGSRKEKSSKIWVNTLAELFVSMK